MESITVEIAGFDLRINLSPTENIEEKERFRRGVLHKYAGFIKNDPKRKPDFIINVVNRLEIETIYKSRKKTFYFLTFLYRSKNIVETYYQIGLTHFAIILRKLFHNALIKTGGFIVHGSAVENKSGAYIFVGPSGAGKSTIMKLLSSKYRPLGDDSVIIKKERKNYYLYQTPIIEQEDRIKKMSQKSRIRRIYFLKKSKKNWQDPAMDKNVVLTHLMEQLWAEKKEGRQEYQAVIDFVKRFDNFSFLSFAKNKSRLLKFFKRYE